MLSAIYKYNNNINWYCQKLVYFKGYIILYLIIGYIMYQECLYLYCNNIVNYVCHTVCLFLILLNFLYIYIYILITDIPRN